MLDRADVFAKTVPTNSPNDSSAFASTVIATVPERLIASAAKSALRVSPRNESRAILCSGQASVNSTLPNDGFESSSFCNSVGTQNVPEPQNALASSFALR